MVKSVRAKVAEKAENTPMPCYLQRYHLFPNRAQKLSLNDIRQHIPQGKIDNPIEVHRAPTSPNDSNYLPLMREYNAKLPENEQFLDKDGNIPLGSNGLPDFDDPAKEQAFRRYTLDLWSGQGLSKDTDNH